MQGAASVYFLCEASEECLTEGGKEESVHGLCEVPRRGKFIETEKRREVPRGWGQRGQRRVQGFYWR